MHTPKTFGGILSFAIASVVTVIVGTYIINRVPPLAAFVYGMKKAA